MSTLRIDSDYLKGRMRNLLVHRYWVVDDFRVYSAVKENFKCVEEFSKTVEDRYGLR